MFSSLMQEQLNAYCDSKTLDLFTVVCSLILKKSWKLLRFVLPFWLSDFWCFNSLQGCYV